MFSVIIRTLKTLFVDIWLLKFIIDAITTGLEFTSVVKFIIVCVVIAFLDMYIEDWINEYVKPIGKNEIHLAMHEMIFKKIEKTDLEKFDNTDFYNDYIWSLEQAEEQVFSCIENTRKLALAVLSISSIAAILISMNPFTILFAVIPMIFVAVIGTKLNVQEYKCAEELNPVLRKEKYSKRVFYLKQYTEDLKMTKIGEVIKNNFRDSAMRAIKIRKIYGKKKFGLMAIQDGSYGVFQMLGLYLCLAYQALVKASISLGTCTAVISAIDRLNGYFYQLSSVLFAIQKNGMFAEKFFFFMNEENTIEDNNQELNETVEKEDNNELKKIEIKNVSFAYPNNKNLTLDNISLSINKNERIAIVGENGAGKTTLVKLLLRLYDPINGEILLNDSNIKKLDVNRYRKHFATVFQNPQIYATSVIENVIMEPCKDLDEQMVNVVKSCLANTNLDIPTTDYNKNLTKEYDTMGIELSGGQKQKLAIARALYTNREIIVMDEASAALDPIAEKEINDILLNKLMHKTVFIITHRLTTVKDVDRVLFMECGKIIEQGTHDELMQKQGRYYRLYNAQAETYLEGR